LLKAGGTDVLAADGAQAAVGAAVAQFGPAQRPAGSAAAFDDVPDVAAQEHDRITLFHKWGMLSKGIILRKDAKPRILGFAGFA